MWLLSALKLIAGIETGPFSEALESEINKLVIGTISLPINLPGTSYNQGLQVTSPVHLFLFKTFCFVLNGLLSDRQEKR